MNPEPPSAATRQQAEHSLLERAQAMQEHTEVVVALRSLAAAYERVGRRADAHWPREAAAVIEEAQDFVSNLAKSLRRRMAGEPAAQRLASEAIALAGVHCVDDSGDLVAGLNSLAARSRVEGRTAHAQWPQDVAEIIGVAHQLMRDLEQALVAPVLR